MPKFNVSLSVRPVISHLIEIEADSEEQAITKAIEMVTKEKGRLPLDYDGNYVEVLSDDVTINEVEEAHSDQSESPYKVDYEVKEVGSE